MDHHTTLAQNTSGLHWGYTTSTSNSGAPSPASVWQQPSRSSVKRALSESDDCDDVFSEESTKEHCTSPGDADSCQMLSRKKRRGVIEKKRRDRINMSLSELKRLVPSAFEKQGSAKLEKAEILQMTVDHLKMIHSKGIDPFAYDPHKYAMDYHGMGYRECAAEVARYLERIEGFDVQNPLRLRLTSHLQCCAAQRELATKQTTSTGPWGYAPPPPPPSSQTYSPLNPTSPTHLNSQIPPHPPPSFTNQHSQNLHDLSGGYEPPPVASMATPIVLTPIAAPPSTATATIPSASILTPLTATTSISALPPPYTNTHHQYPTTNAFHIPPASLSHPHHYQSHHHHQQNYNPNGNIPTSQGGMKPYRPWGAEVAY